MWSAGIVGVMALCSNNESCECEEPLHSTMYRHIPVWYDAAGLGRVSASADMVRQLCPSPLPEKQGLQRWDELWHQLAACTVGYFAELLICHAEQSAQGT